jgi:hypothetical protein
MAYGVPYVRWLACGGYMSYHTVARKRLKRCVARHREALREEAELARRPGEQGARVTWATRRWTGTYPGTVGTCTCTAGSDSS